MTLPQKFQGITVTTVETFFNQHVNSLINELLEMIKIPAICVDGGPAIREMAESVAQKCETAGLTTRIEDTAGHPVVYGVGGPEDAPFTLLLYGHYDVFPVSGQSSWKTDPFDPVRVGDRIFARGSGDNKGQFLAHLIALRWWHEEAGGLPIRVKVIIEGEEEAGSRHLPEFIHRNRDELDADLCVYSDGPMLAGDQPALLFGARGAIVLEFSSAGPVRPVHSGNFGGVVANPIVELARLFAELVAPNGDLQAAGINDGLPVPTPEERAALRNLDVDLDTFRESTGTSPITERFGENYYDRLLYKPSFNVSGFQGGYSGKGFRTLIPTTATATVDMRLVGDQDPDQVFASVDAFIRERHYPGIQVRKVMSQPPSRTPIDHPYSGFVHDALLSTFHNVPKKVPSLAGTTPDYVFTKILGIPSIMVPLAPVDENHHGPNESMKVSLFMQGVRFYASLIELLSHAGIREVKS
jgi:acetylornithine deacetylase/succinyl-diaminopimelate desuccinylase-like protein